jgi:hypothetical protein
MKMQSVVAVTCVLVLLAASASAQQRGGRGFGFGGRSQSLVGLAAQESVQKDLGLSADLVGKIGPLNDEYRAAREKEGVQFPTGLRDLPEAERNAKMEEYNKKSAEVAAKLDAEFTPKLQAILGADGVKRLKQIQIQSQGALALNNAAVATELKLTDEQKKKVAALISEYQAKTQGLFGQGSDFQEAAAKMRELNKERDTKVEALLTPEQKTAYTALKGKAFDVSTLSFGGRGGRRGNNN